MRRPTILALLLALALFLVACGGGDDESAAPKGPTKQQDIAAIEQMLLAYGAAVGGDVCDYQAPNLIAVDGSIENCRQVNKDADAVLFEVKKVAVNGDEATAEVLAEGDTEVGTYELRRVDGEWKISGLPFVDDPAETPAEEGTAPADPDEGERTEVEQLLTDFGQASGDDVCDFFSEGLLEERGGLKSCQQYFADKPPLDSEIVDLSLFIPGPYQDALPSATAVIKSGVSGNNLNIVLAKSSSPDDPYGGWEISQSD